MRYGWLLIGAIMVSTADAEMYRWQDEYGRWQFSDKPPAHTTITSPVEQVRVPAAQETQSVHIPHRPKSSGSPWLTKERNAYRQKKSRRLKQEKQQRQQQRQEERCRAARDAYRSIQNSFYRASSPNALNKRRERLKKQKRKIKESCG